MSPRRVGRTRPCGSADARARLRQARLYLEVATLVASDEPGEHATVATANAVLAGIAAADAMCCAIAGERFRGDDHRRAAEYLGQITGDTARFFPPGQSSAPNDIGQFSIPMLTSRSSANLMSGFHVLRNRGH